MLSSFPGCSFTVHLTSHLTPHTSPPHTSREVYRDASCLDRCRRHTDLWQCGLTCGTYGRTCGIVRTDLWQTGLWHSAACAAACAAPALGAQPAWPATGYK
eukprot:364179-Chlamydomonas_euryale.AAC.3